MTVRALLTDLDRTLTGRDLVPDARAFDRIARLRAAGVEVVIVTGRPFEHCVERGYLAAASALVAENGAVLVQGRVADFVDAGFPDRCVAALGDLAPRVRWGSVVGSAPREIAPDVAARLGEAGVAHDLSFNADEVMVLPPGVDKAHGARRVLALLGVAPEHAAAVGDGENDVPLFRAVARSAAVANAHPAARSAATERLRRGYADGFVEFADAILAEARLARRVRVEPAW